MKGRKRGSTFGPCVLKRRAQKNAFRLFACDVEASLVTRA